MADAKALTLAFLDAHPQEAARALEMLPAAEASALFGELPARAGAPVLSAMLPPAAARVLGGLGEEQVLALLAAAGTQATVVILRHVAETRRARLITGLPTATAMASRLLLGFPEDAVGAWADPEVIALPPGTRVAEALQRIRQGQIGGIGRILVVDSERHVIGEVSFEALLHAPDGVSIASLVRAPAATLPAMMPLAAAAALEEWETSSSLPVVDRERRLIGVLRRNAAMRALRDRTRLGRTDGASLASAVAAGYWNVVSGLTGSTLLLLPRVKRVLPENR